MGRAATACLIGFVACFFAAFTFVVKARIALGERQQASFDSLAQNPAAFVLYALGLPTGDNIFPFADDDEAAHDVYKKWRRGQDSKDPDASADDAADDGDDFAQLFLLAYGAWLGNSDGPQQVELVELLSRHCGSQEFTDIMARTPNPKHCASVPPEVGCHAGFFVDADGVARQCPDGAFCPSDQTCFILCARGASCNASVIEAAPEGKSWCEYPFEASQRDHFDFEIGACPGAKHETLCPRGFSCDTPVTIARCPAGYFCPLGSDAPVRCPWFATCAEAGKDRPEYSSVFSEAAACAVVLLLCAYWGGARLRDRALKRLDSSLFLELRKAASADSLAPGTPDSLSATDAPSAEEDRHDDLPHADPLIDIGFRDLSLAIPGAYTDRTVLDAVCGKLRSGRLTAIVGPSGAGKTTLLDMLASKLPPAGSTLTGRVTYNGHATDAAGRRVHAALFAFVPQDDAGLLPWLSVRETLAFYAAIRERRERRPTLLLAPGAGNERRAKLSRKDYALKRDLRVARVVHELGLHSERHSLVGTAGDARNRGLSGGQRKRVSVAVELVADPSVLFLDEPTSGLDAATSRAVVRALVRAARRGLTCAAVLHQPSAKMWRAFDDVLVFAPGGRVAYYGPQSQASKCFEDAVRLRDAEACKHPDDSAPDFILECVSAYQSLVCANQDEDEDAPAAFHADADTVTNASLRVNTPSASEQFVMFSLRAVLEVARHPSTLAYELLLQGCAGAFLGALFPHFEFGDIQQVGFILQLSLGLTIALSAARTFGADRAAYWRELTPRAGMALHAPSLFGAKCLVELPRLALLTAAFLGSWYPTAKPQCAFGSYFGPCLGASLAASGAAHVFSIAQDAKEAQLSTVFFLVACSMFSGVSPRLYQLQQLGLGTRLVVWSSYARWLVEACFAAEVSSLSSAWRMPPAFYKHPMQESAFQGLLINDYTARADRLDTAILVLLGVGFRLAALACLVTTNRDRMGLRSLSHIIFDVRSHVGKTASALWRRAKRATRHPSPAASPRGGKASERTRLPPAAAEYTRLDLA
ncbi:hypothetical protein M885DRAFT_463371 [Pelagophyceae sp. CCMP2097]|nr:hypothetical protein M885DRAFT_463371 [Pelagophyceae sp. CCMP2097]|mmetsp:Transcript_24996/g.85663  ORF Transcript_24996/g.85663 Transcript_24996/m.85663 type:complete len:1043 (-) Transcript_24996:77-3205(-)|eukprot:CAMPEP_0184188582 /NCGR_PEP_ID=MMETSP0976-20121227/1514_1 /TAXON_ID=483370 /ORGANISM="non described non described, Strain CCMP2097" /LENGTH=1042 /DNA_ID=CAMNT_0026492911 /DNA_START=159 /DNA_END=3287 /DNA_ORIENTATION=-